MKKRIAILGIGGVGGYVGGHLAKKYARTNEFEVVFFARGEHSNKIKENGLNIKIIRKEYIDRPTSGKIKHFYSLIN